MTLNQEPRSSFCKLQVLSAFTVADIGDHVKEDPTAFAVNTFVG
jgi:hypothetical protein